MEDRAANSSNTRRAAEALRGARRVLAITGAGISADSGLPTYRGIGGLYESDDTEDGIPIEVALSGEMLRRRPELTWKYLAQIEAACRGCRPNPGHFALARMEELFDDFCLLTQNIDGLHRRAGSRKLIEIHGRHDRIVCTGCGRSREVPDWRDLEIPPRCRACGAPERPDVVLFGELLPEDALTRLHAFLADGVDAVLSIGTSSVFPYIAGPVLAAARAGVPTIEVNPGRSEVSDVVSHRIAGRAADVLPRLVETLEAT